MKPITDYFDTLRDDRLECLIAYPLREILLSSLTSLLCGAKDFDEIIDYSEEYLDWLRKYYPFKHGIACSVTYQRIFRGFDHKKFAACFAQFSHDLCGLEGEIVAIDGKALRGSKEETGKQGTKNGALYMVSAFACERGLTLGQASVAGKSNEITAIPALLEVLDLKGAIATLDAMGTQKEIAAAIIEKQADYVLALKGNQGLLHEDVTLFFDENGEKGAFLSDETQDFGHGRVEKRECRMSTAIGWLKDRHPHWKNLTSIIELKSTRTFKKTNETTVEKRYFISSLNVTPQKMLYIIRSHWKIESFHWSLDVAFREDECRTRKDNAPHNFAILRKFAYNLLKNEPTKRSIKRKFILATLKTDYREKLILSS